MSDRTNHSVSRASRLLSGGVAAALLGCSPTPRPDSPPAAIASATAATQPPTSSTPAASRALVAPVPTGTFDPPRVCEHCGARDVPPPILFSPNSTEPLSEGRTLLDEALEILKAHPAMKIRVEGHADPAEMTSLRFDIAAKRAKAIHDWLVAQGVDASRIEVVSYGASRAGARGPGKDRRVELRDASSPP